MKTSTSVVALADEATNGSTSEVGALVDASDRSSAAATPLVRHQMEARLASLKSEYEKGQMQLRQLESVRETMLRISGAIAVLEELLPSEPPLPDAAPKGHR